MAYTAQGGPHSKAVAPVGATATTLTKAGDINSRFVSWWSVHEFAINFFSALTDWPMAGTPAWCALDDGDPRKLAAVLDAGQHHALRVEVAQEARAEASKAIAAAVDWPAMARELHQMDDARRRGARIERQVV